jgi:hypothetical protein
VARGAIIISFIKETGKEERVIEMKNGMVNCNYHYT